MPANPPGRPTNLTPEMIDYLVKFIPEAITQNQLARLSGVPQQCLCDWLKRGKEDRINNVDSVFAQFSVKYEEEKGKLIKGLLIKMANQGTFQSLQWMLEQCFPDEFGLNALEIKELLDEVKEIKKIRQGEQL